MTTRVLDRQSTRPAAASLGWKLVLGVGFAAATGLAAQIQIPLPFTPVPITGQTAVVLLSGAALGSAWGAVSMGLYLLAGALGAPLFAGGEAGPAALLGSTGGYLLAFVLVAPLVGRTLPPDAGPARAFGVMLAASAVVLLWGMLQLALVLGVPLERAFAMGVAPFLIGDLVKAAAATVGFRAARGPITRLREPWS